MDYFSYLKQIGLYARQKCLHQEDKLAWKNDFRETVDSLYAGQLPNGS